MNLNTRVGRKLAGILGTARQHLATPNSTCTLALVLDVSSGNSAAIACRKLRECFAGTEVTAFYVTHRASDGPEAITTAAEITGDAPTEVRPRGQLQSRVAQSYVCVTAFASVSWRRPLLAQMEVKGRRVGIVAFPTGSSGSETQPQEQDQHQQQYEACMAKLQRLMQRFFTRAALVGNVVRTPESSRERLVRLLTSDKDKFDHGGWPVSRHDLCVRLSLLGPRAIDDLCDLYTRSFESWDTFVDMFVHRHGPFALAKGLLDVSDPRARHVQRDASSGPRLLPLIAKDIPGPRQSPGGIQEPSETSSGAALAEESTPDEHDLPPEPSSEAHAEAGAGAEADSPDGAEAEEPSQVRFLLHGLKEKVHFPRHSRHPPHTCRCYPTGTLGASSTAFRTTTDPSWQRTRLTRWKITLGSRCCGSTQAMPESGVRCSWLLALQTPLHTETF